MSSKIRTVAKPGGTRANRTGAWRSFRPVFMHELCNKCGICAMYCPDGVVIKTPEGFFIPDYDYCKGCGICAEECPKKAIKMVLEEK